MKERVSMSKKLIISKRTTILILLFIIIFSIVIRYPSIPHQRGDDGFMNSSLARSITEEGYAKWIISSYSYFGLGPFSYSSAIHFTISTISQLTGVSIDGSVLILNMIIAVCGTIFSFVMMKELTKNIKLALLGSFMFSTSPIFMQYTIWTGSSRPLLMIILILLIFLLARMRYARITEQHSNNIEIKYTALFILFLIVTGTIHRMSIFILFILLGYLFARPLLRLRKLITIKNGVWKEKKHLFYSISFFIIWTVSILFILLAQLENIGLYNGMNLWSKYENGLFFSGTSPHIIFLNMVVDYLSGIGLLSIFGLIGAVQIFRQRNKDFKKYFFLLSILLISPLATLGLYAQLILLVFLIPFIVQGILWAISLKSIRRMAVPALLILIISSSVFSLFMTNHWMSQKDGMTEWEYDTGLYVGNNLGTQDTYISNNIVFGNKMLFVSYSNFLTERYPYPIIFDWQDKTSIERVIDWPRMIDERSIEIRYPEEAEIAHDHRFIVQNSVRDTSFVRSIYNVNYVVESPESTTTYFMGPSIYNSDYLIFDNGVGRLWYIG